MSDTFRLDGVVRDHSDEPMPGVEVQVYPSPAVNADDEALHVDGLQFTTGSEGQVTDGTNDYVELFTGPGVRYTIHSTAAGLPPRTFDAPAADEVVHLQDIPFGVVSPPTPEESWSALLVELNALVAAAQAAEQAEVTELLTEISGKVAKAGDTMTGPLTLSGDPTNASHAATRGYVLAQLDALKTALTGAAPAELDTFVEAFTHWQGTDSALTALAGVVGGKQLHDATLDALSGLPTTTAGRALLNIADAAALRTAAGLDHVANKSPAELAADAALTTAYVSPRSEGRAARWVARMSDRTKPLFYDSFDRADSATVLGTADSGHAWSALSGTWGIATRRAQLQASSEGVASVDLGVPADFIQCDVELRPSGTPDPGVLIRCKDANNFILVAYETGGNLNIWTKVAGSYTTIGTAFSTIYTNGRIVFLRAEYQRGTGKITATLAGGNGTLSVATATLSSGNRAAFEADTHVGLRSGTTDTASAYASLIAGVK